MLVDVFAKESNITFCFLLKVRILMIFDCVQDYLRRYLKTKGKYNFSENLSSMKKPDHYLWV